MTTETATQEPQTFTEVYLTKELIESPRLARFRAWPAEYRATLVAVLLASAVFLPYLGAVGLWDPWETHYGEVAREMVQRRDYVHPYWENAWFFSKPAFTMWMMAAGMQGADLGAAFFLVLGLAALAGGVYLIRKVRFGDGPLAEFLGALLLAPGGLFTLLGFSGTFRASPDSFLARWAIAGLPLATWLVIVALAGAAVALLAWLRTENAQHRTWALLALGVAGVLLLAGVHGSTQPLPWKHAGIAEGDGALPLYTEWGFRLPFALASILAVGLLTYAVTRLVSPRAGLATAFVLVTMPLYFVISRQAVTDTPIVAFTLAGVACALVALYDKGSKKKSAWWYAVYVFFAAATLAKGLLGFGVPMVVFIGVVLLTVVEYRVDTLWEHTQWAGKHVGKELGISVAAGAVAYLIASRVGEARATMFMSSPAFDQGFTNGVAGALLVALFVLALVGWTLVPGASRRTGAEGWFGERVAVLGIPFALGALALAYRAGSVRLAAMGSAALAQAANTGQGQPWWGNLLVSLPGGTRAVAVVLLLAGVGYALLYLPKRSPVGSWFAAGLGLLGPLLMGYGERLGFGDEPWFKPGFTALTAAQWLGIMWGSLVFWGTMTYLVGQATKKLEGRPPALWAQMFEMRLGTGILLFLACCLPWYYEMFTFWRVDDESKLFWFRFIVHDHFARLGAGVHTTTPGGDFTYFIQQGGFAMFPWVALIPGALAVVGRLKLKERSGFDQVGLVAVLSFVVTWALIGSSATKFHHYVLPMLPWLAMLMGLYIDRLWEEGLDKHLATLLFGVPIFLLVAKDLSNTPKNFTDLFVYNYDRPYPTFLTEQVVFGGQNTKQLLYTAFVGFLGLSVVVAVLRWKSTLFTVASVGILSFALWFNWSHWVDLSHHWTQRDQFWRYYRDRRPGEPIAAFLMNWRGETFYSRNTVKQIKDNANVGMANYAAQPGRKWSLVEHARLGILKGAVGADKTVTLIDKDLNNKFVLVTIE